MNLEDIVASQKFSEKLRKLGFPQVDSIYYWVPGIIGYGFDGPEITASLNLWSVWRVPNHKPGFYDFVNVTIPKDKTDVDYYDKLYKAEVTLANNIIAAPTAEELAQYLPDSTHRLNKLRMGKGFVSYSVPPVNRELAASRYPDLKIFNSFKSNTLVNAMAEALIWLVENGYVKFEEVT